MDRIHMGQKYEMFGVGEQSNEFMDNLVDCIKEYKDEIYSIDNEESKLKAFLNRKPKTDEELRKQYDKLVRGNYIQTQSFDEYLASERKKDLDYNSVVIHFPEKLAEYESIANAKISFLETRKNQYLSIEQVFMNGNSLGMGVNFFDENGRPLENEELDKKRARLRYAINQIDKYIKEIKEDIDLRKKSFDEIQKLNTINVETSPEEEPIPKEETIPEEVENSVDTEKNLDYDIYISGLTNEELEEELRKLEEEYKRIKEFGGADESKLKDLQDKIHKIRKEIAKRKPQKKELSELTDDELDKLQREKKDKLADEWNFRAHYQNGMEGNEDVEINKLNEEIEEIEEEKKRRKKLAEEEIKKDESEEKGDKKTKKDDPTKDDTKEEQKKDPADKEEELGKDKKEDLEKITLPVKVKFINRSKLSKIGKVVLIAMAAVTLVGLPLTGFFLGSALATGFGISAASAGLSAVFGAVGGLSGFGIGNLAMQKALDISKELKNPRKIAALENEELKRYVSGMIADIEGPMKENAGNKIELNKLKLKCQQRIILLEHEIEKIENELKVDPQKQFESHAMYAAKEALEKELIEINKLLSSFETTKEAVEEVKKTVETTEEKEETLDPTTPEEEEVFSVDPESIKRSKEEKKDPKPVEYEELTPYEDTEEDKENKFNVDPEEFKFEEKTSDYTPYEYSPDEEYSVTYDEEEVKARRR